MSEKRREVRVGDEHFVLRPFRGFKALLVMERMTGLMDVVPEIQDEVRNAMREHRQANLIEIPRNVFELRYPEDAGGISETGWEKAGQVIRLPDPEALPFDGAAVLITVLPKIIKVAKSEVIDLLALVVVKDTDLRQADEDDTTDKVLADIGKRLLYEGTLDELAELATEAFALVQEQFSGKVAELVKTASSVLTGAMDDLDDPLPNSGEMTPESSNETSSISSPESTDGPDSKLSGTGGMTSPDLPTGSVATSS